MNKIDFIISELTPIEEAVKKYKWTDLDKDKIKENCPLKIIDGQDPLQKNLFLKHNLKKSLEENFENHQKNEEFLKSAFWVIQDWGKIALKRIKNNNDQTNDNIVNNFSKKIYKGDLDLDVREANIISSLSKVASFLKPDRCAIYDSRAVLSLNWLLFKYNKIFCKKELYFPQPEGAGIASDLDLKFIIRMAEESPLSLSDFNKSLKNEIQYEEREKYLMYCTLMKDLSDVLYKKLNLNEHGFKNYPYIAEMFLFVFSDRDLKYLDQDILKSIYLKFK